MHVWRLRGPESRLNSAGGGYDYDPDTLLVRWRDPNFPQSLIANPISDLHEHIHYLQITSTTIGAFYYFLLYGRRNAFMRGLNRLPESIRKMLFEKRCAGNSIVGIRDDIDDIIDPSNDYTDPLNLLRDVYFNLLYAAEMWLHGLNISRTAGLKPGDVLAIASRDALLEHAGWFPSLDEFGPRRLRESMSCGERRIPVVPVGDDTLSTADILECHASMNELLLKSKSRIHPVAYGSADPDPILVHGLKEAPQWDVVAAQLPLIMNSVYGKALRVFHQFSGFASLNSDATRQICTFFACVEFSLNPKIPPLFVPKAEMDWADVLPAVRLALCAEATKHVGPIKEWNHAALVDYADRLGEVTGLEHAVQRRNDEEGGLEVDYEMLRRCQSSDEVNDLASSKNWLYINEIWRRVNRLRQQRASAAHVVASPMLKNGFLSGILLGESEWAQSPVIAGSDNVLMHRIGSNPHVNGWFLSSVIVGWCIDQLAMRCGPPIVADFPLSRPGPRHHEMGGWIAPPGGGPDDVVADLSENFARMLGTRPW